MVCKKDEPSKEVAVPMVKVQLLQSTKILPRQSVQVTARIEEVAQGTWLLKPDDELMSTGIFADEAVLQIEKETVQVVLSNPTGITQRVEEGTLVGTAECVDIIPMDSEAESASVKNMSIPNNSLNRKSMVRELFDNTENTENLTVVQKKKFVEFLAEKHDVFALEEGEKGETDLVQMEVITGEAPPKKQRPYRLPFAAREEVAR